MKKLDANRGETRGSTAAKTRQRLDRLPFSRASEQKKASDKIRYKLWERLEYARIFRELLDKPEFQFLKEEFMAGVVVGYQGQPDDYLAKIYSDGLGIKVVMNKNLLEEMPASSHAMLEVFIRSMSDSFSKSYYQMTGILSVDEESIDQSLKELRLRKE